MTSSWDETKLWFWLGRREGDAAETLRTLVKKVMPGIEKLLRAGGTVPLNFTLHDDEHSFRVAERMSELTPEGVEARLSDIEIALLLLSAYLHDIGMSPAWDTAVRHRAYLLGKTGKSLSADEERGFRHWLDEHHGELEVPLPSGSTTSESVDEIIAYYCRHRHNDWSGDWIRDNIAADLASVYRTLPDDLITLCPSHHEGLPDLRARRFEAKDVAAPARLVNLRYLAALLRLADVLDVDPERTPEVILRHRAIPASSRIYWSKDHDLSLRVDQSQHELRLSARTRDARGHRAVLETVQQIDDELQCCVALASERAFGRGAVRDGGMYPWPWPARLVTDVEEHGRSFVYIDGAFRPDVEHVLGLLSGEALYGEPLAAVRELLQNAFDAVREQIAYERLDQPDPEDSSYEATIGRLRRVVLSLALKGDHW